MSNKRNQNIVLNVSEEHGRQIKTLRELTPVHFKSEIGKNYHIKALDSHLILSSSAGSRTTVSGSLNIIPGSINTAAGGDANFGGVVNLSLNWPYNIRHTAGHLILSSSVGSTVAVSGNLKIAGASNLAGVLATQIDLQGGANYHIRHTAGHLILSSSVGSTVAVSGNLKILSGNIHIRSLGDAFIFLEADTDNATEEDNAFIKFSQDGNIIRSIIGTCGDAGKDPENNAYTDTLVNATLLGTTSGYPLQLGANSSVAITADTSGRVGIGTTSPSSKLDVAGNIESNILLLNTQQQSHVQAVASHLILSSSVGSTVAVSGAIKLLPIPEPTLSSALAGTVYIHEDSNRLSISDGYSWNRVIDQPFSILSSSLGLVGTSETIFSSSAGVPIQYRIPANTLRAGSVLKIFAYGTINNAGSNLTIKTRFNTTSGPQLQTTIFTPVVSDRWMLDLTGVCRGVGTVNLFTYSKLYYGLGDAAATTEISNLAPAIDTTIDNDLFISAFWSSTGDDVDMDAFVVWLT